MKDEEKKKILARIDGLKDKIEGTMKPNQARISEYRILGITVIRKITYLEPVDLWVKGRK